MKPKMLMSWIGYTDLRAARGEKEAGLGPIAQALRSREFDSICLLSNYGKREESLYAKWISETTRSPVKIFHYPLSSPTRFDEIYESAVSAIEKVKKQAKHRSALFTYHLSPGTPAMAAIWLLLANTTHPAELIESSKEHGIKTVSFPFELAADYIPVLKSKADTDIIKLARALPPEAPEIRDIVHRCDQMKRVIDKARIIAAHDVPVLLQGESGTGKELVARAIHASGSRSRSPFIAVNCGAIPKDMLEAEFFGYEKGAFTGAVKSHAGYFESADKGSLFLDEIAELPLSAQVKLLRVIQERTVQRLGKDKPVEIDVRIIAATNRNLIEQVAAGAFRSDLFHRIAVGVIQLPPLRDRRGDINLLVDSFLNRINKKLSKNPVWRDKKLSAGARNLVQKHPWYGNVRELYNTLLRAAIWVEGDTIQTGDIREALFSTGIRTDPESDVMNRELGEGFDLRGLLSEIEAHYLKKAMKQAKGNKTRAAELTGFPNYQTFSNRLQKYRLIEDED